jgi:beta-aspartyl-peptidase (threonine type)
MARKRLALVSFGLLITVGSALAGQDPPPADPAREARPAWALAIHGGAGTPPRDMPEERRKAYRESLASVLADGRDRLAAGGSALDVVEALILRFEDDALFNAGKGAVFNADGRHDLDAAIMDGSTLACGAVAGLTTVRHPIALARLVMERTGHVFLAGQGAERFADEVGVERVPNEWFSTPERLEQLRKRQAEGKFGTVGVVALDRGGRLAAGTSSGGLTNKKWGRIGDVPVIGAGTYADQRVAVSCTGKGEEFIRHGIARELAALVRYDHRSLAEAGRILMEERLRRGDGGLIAVDAEGKIVLVYNTDGMLRGAADPSGRFEVSIWEQPEPR